VIVFEILGAVAIIIIGVIIVSQVIIPATFGRLLFPFFRRTSELDHQLIELDQIKADLEKAEQVRQAADEIAKVSQPNQPKE
jgi:hypothetical protein